MNVISRCESIGEDGNKVAFLGHFIPRTDTLVPHKMNFVHAYAKEVGFGSSRRTKGYMPKNRPPGSYEITVVLRDPSFEL